MTDYNFPLALSYDDVLLVPQYSEIKSRSEVNLETQLTPKLKLKLPLTSANMSDVTGVEMAIGLGKLGAFGFLPRFEDTTGQVEQVEKVRAAGVQVGASVGVKEGFLERAEQLVEAGAQILLLDVAHGHMKTAIDATKLLRERFADQVDIIAGNVATEEAADALFKAGADCVKVGIGPGSICITRVVTGFGVPQLTAVMEAAKAARKHSKTILADGGIKTAGDIAKALAAGADAVMMGSMFAGTDESPGELVDVNGQMFKTYNGSTSPAEKLKHTQKLADTGKNYLGHIEGVESMVPYKGPVANLITSWEHSLKSAFSYAGAFNLEQFHANAQFVRVTPLGNRENGAHDVITK